MSHVAINILSFLKRNATKEGHTYWLFKRKNDPVVKLYDLTSLCEQQLSTGEDQTAEDFDEKNDTLNNLEADYLNFALPKEYSCRDFKIIRFFSFLKSQFYYISTTFRHEFMVPGCHQGRTKRI